MLVPRFMQERLEKLNHDPIPKRRRCAALQNASRGSKAKDEPRGFGVRRPSAALALSEGRVRKPVAQRVIVIREPSFHVPP
jgi:hypothetical protein